MGVLSPLHHGWVWTSATLALPLASNFLTGKINNYVIEFDTNGLYHYCRVCSLLLQYVTHTHTHTTNGPSQTVRYQRSGKYCSNHCEVATVALHSQHNHIFNVFISIDGGNQEW